MADLEVTAVVNLGSRLIVFGRDWNVTLVRASGPDAGDPEDEDEFDNPWIGD